MLSSRVGQKFEPKNATTFVGNGGSFHDLTTLRIKVLVSGYYNLPTLKLIYSELTDAVLIDLLTDDAEYYIRTFVIALAILNHVRWRFVVGIGQGAVPLFVERFAQGQ